MLNVYSVHVISYIKYFKRGLSACTEGCTRPNSCDLFMGQPYPRKPIFINNYIAGKNNVIEFQ